jgi:SAM-dependent methyltransferase
VNAKPGSSALRRLWIYARYYATIVYYKFRYPRRSVFETIHEKRTWGGDSASGSGSDLPTTGSIRSALPDLISDLEIRSMLDAPCGDFHWMAHVSLDLDRYVGVDIVPRLIDENVRKYGSEKIQFFKADITCSDLPKVDLILCRDCLPHLSYKDIFRCLGNFRRAGAQYLLSSTYPGLVRRHWNIASGMYRPLDLQLPPFNFPKPLRVLRDGVEGDMFTSNKRLGLWKISDLPTDFRERSSDNSNPAHRLGADSRAPRTANPLPFSIPKAILAP